MQQLYGNQRAHQTLAFAMQSGRLCHAYLIEGEDGTGKTAFAKRFAQAILCTGSGEKPCGSCPACYKTARFVHPDLHLYLSDGKKNSFHVKAVREVKESVYTKPNEGQYKVYIFCRADSMTTEAQNALLKMLEEPPEDTVFLLTCRSRQAVLETVVSRCVPVQLEPAGEAACIRALTEGGHADEEQASALAKRFHGNIGQALDSLQDEAFQAVLSRKEAVLEALAAGSEYGLMKALSAYENRKPELYELLTTLEETLRDAASYKLSGPELLGIFPDQAKRLGDKLTLLQCQKLTAFCGETRTLLDFNANLPLTLLAFCGKVKTLAL